MESNEEVLELQEQVKELEDRIYKLEKHEATRKVKSGIKLLITNLSYMDIIMSLMNYLS